MALQDIINVILEDAQKQVSEIREKGKKEAEKLKKDGDLQIERAKEEAQKEVRLEKQKKLGFIRFEERVTAENLILKEKWKLIDRVYDLALKKLCSLDDKNYLALVKKLLNKIPKLEKGETIPIKGKETLIKQALEELGLSHSLSLNPIEDKGGFLFRNDKVEIDNRFQTLIEGSKFKTESEVAKILFS